jgi:hypothetical protein
MEPCPLNSKISLGDKAITRVVHYLWETFSPAAMGLSLFQMQIHTSAIRNLDHEYGIESTYPLQHLLYFIITAGHQSIILASVV